ncbi:MAG: hypothetical protein HRT69_17965 [Flavobacteriaceae bacterium]|nr:hypothetical protein [Flavobacteriaceae bacterium]
MKPTHLYQVTTKSKAIHYVLAESISEAHQKVVNEILTKNDTKNIEPIIEVDFLTSNLIK